MNYLEITYNDGKKEFVQSIEINKFGDIRFKDKLVSPEVIKEIRLILT